MIQGTAVRLVYRIQQTATGWCIWFIDSTGWSTKHRNHVSTFLVNPSDLSYSSTLEDLGQHLPRPDEPELEHWLILFSWTFSLINEPTNPSLHENIYAFFSSKRLFMQDILHIFEICFNFISLIQEVNSKCEYKIKNSDVKMKYI